MAQCLHCGDDLAEGVECLCREAVRIRERDRSRERVERGESAYVLPPPPPKPLPSKEQLLLAQLALVTDEQESLKICKLSMAERRRELAVLTKQIVELSRECRAVDLQNAEAAKSLSVEQKNDLLIKHVKSLPRHAQRELVQEIMRAVNEAAG